MQQVDPMLVCFNGNFIAHENASISINDGAFLYGDTLFETFKARQQKILLSWQHLDRLEQSAKLLNLPCDRIKIESAMHHLSRAIKHPSSRIRLTLSRGNFTGLDWPANNKGNFLLTAVEYNEPTDAERQAGVACIIAPNQRINPLSHLQQMKRGNYADCLYAANYAHQAGAREALFMDQQNNIQEGATSNIFALIEDRLITPPIDNLILAGVMRQQIIDTAAELGVLVVEQKLSLDELIAADEIFLTNSLIDILPVASINNQTINRGDCWKSILKTLKLRIET